MAEESMIFIANVLIVLGAMFGMYFIAHKNKYGFIIFLIVEASMAYIGYTTGNWGLVLTAGLYFVMNIYSWYKWSEL